jgi:hypothetical protein
MTLIVTTHYRYKRPPQKRKTAPLAGPGVPRTPGLAPAVARGFAGVTTACSMIHLRFLTVTFRAPRRRTPVSGSHS